MKVRLGDYIREYSVRNKSEEDIPVYSVTNTQGFCQDYFGKEVASKDKSTYKIVPRGHFAYNPSRINVGSVDWQRYEDSVIVSPLYNVFSVTPELDQQYLFYYLKSDFALQRIKAVARGSVRDNLRLEMLYEFPIRIPSISEQKDIAGKLDKVKQILALREQELSSLDDLIKARFVEMFGDGLEYKRLEEYTTLVTKGASPKWQGIEYCDEGTLFVTSENVREGFVDLSKRKYLPDDINKILPRSVLRKNDILINIVGASIGRAAVYESDELANINQAVALVRLIPNAINKDFLLAFLNGEEAQKAYIAMKKGGARDNLSLKNIADLQIPVATVEQQNEFATFVAQVDKSKAVVQKALDEAQVLFDSLMQQYFG